VASVPARHRLTTRLRAAAGAAVTDRGATVEQAGREAGLSWPTVWAATLGYAAVALPAALAPVRVLGIDENRRGRRRLTHNPDTHTWEVAVDAWHVGFVDIGGGQGLLGQVEGRTREAVIGWLQAQPQRWRDHIDYVAIDMCTVFASAVAQVLPVASLVVDHFHVVQLANKTLGDVRRRVTWTVRGRRGRKGDGEWDVRNLLTRNMEQLSERRFARMWNTLVDLGDAGYEILAAYKAKELLRELLALARNDPSPHRIRQRLHAFYHWCAQAEPPELHRLASTIDRWWPAIEAFIHTRITNAASEGVNRVAKLTARNAYGFRNPVNQRLRVRCATTRRSRGHLSTRRTERTYRPRRTSDATQIPLTRTHERTTLPRPNHRRRHRQTLPRVSSPVNFVDPNKTNNASEQAIRGPKRHQKISGYWQSTLTLTRYCRVRSYLVSARNHGLRTIDAIHAALAGRPWLPTPATA
jgi:hypothetical protein